VRTALSERCVVMLRSQVVSGRWIVKIAVTVYLLNLLGDDKGGEESKKWKKEGHHNFSLKLILLYQEFLISSFTT